MEGGLISVFLISFDKSGGTPMLLILFLIQRDYSFYKIYSLWGTSNNNSVFKTHQETQLFIVLSLGLMTNWNKCIVTVKETLQAD